MNTGFGQHALSIGTKIQYGPGVHENVGSIAKEYGCRRALLVTDANLVRAGVAGKVEGKLREAGLDVRVSDGVKPNPTDDNVHAAAALLRETRCDLAVAVGGGSVMDCAKCATVMANNPGRINDYESATASFPNGKACRLITLPTTSGTGAEIIGWAVITDTSRSYKMSVGSPDIEPAYALVDPVLTLGLPPRPTAESGVDALSQNIESIISNLRAPITQELALYAVRLISENLPVATFRGSDLEARCNMSLASLLGGINIMTSGVTIVHSLAETLGGFYDLPHGLAIALVLPSVLEFNMGGDHELYARIAGAMGVDTASLSVREAAGRLVPRVTQMLRDLGFPTARQASILKDDLPEIARLALANPNTPTNPRAVTAADLESVLSRALEG